MQRGYKALVESRHDPEGKTQEKRKQIDILRMKYINI
jgi:hypothetical protein